MQTLKPLLGQALASSESSDEKLLELEQQIERDRLERKQEQIDSQERYAQLSSRADRLQSYFDGLSERLTTFSGSEEQKYQIASEALEGIQQSAAALEIQARLLKWACRILGSLALAGGAYAGGHAAGWW